MTHPEAQTRIDEIAARAEKATPEPWHESMTNGHHATIWDATGYCKLAIIYGELIDGNNAQFIAHARSDVPWLLSQLSSAQDEIARAEERGYLKAIEEKRERIDGFKAENERLRAIIAEARDAMSPFAKCIAEWRAEFDACQHDWQEPYWFDGDEGKICRKCSGFVANERR